jgi:formylglycine-generating enzyme required for sulfatase activity
MPFDGPNAKWGFVHRILREALTAEYLAEIAENDGVDAVLKLVGSVGERGDRWAEPLALLAGLLKSPEKLIRLLMREDRALGLRTVANAQGLSGELLTRVLGLSQNSQERAAIYRRIPELMEGPRVALSLLDRLRRQTRNGEDLFYLGQAAGSVGVRWPAYEEQAQRLRQRLYDHIPSPPEELFTLIDTACNGRVLLWKEIPSGQFMMGSPDGIGEEDEHPRHLVIIERPFRIMAVPVTNAQFAAFDPSRRPTEGLSKDWADLPATGIRPVEAISFCRWLSLMVPMAHGARLPTEEEWEYACRAGSPARYWSGETEADLSVIGWYDANSSDRPHRVGEKRASPWGLYDMHGNVGEWTASRYGYSSYLGSGDRLTVDPSQVEPDDDAFILGRVFRGGSFRRSVNAARSASRGGSYRSVPWSFVDIGFRILLPQPPRTG